MTLYEITGDLLALNTMLDDMVDENGDPREPTAEELETMRQWFDESESDFKKKFDGYCRLIKNMNLSAENADSERKIYKGELDRLSKRAKAFENRAKAVKGLLWWNMERLHMNKYKTDLFSAAEQNTRATCRTLEGFDYSKLPEQYLKPREVNTSAIMDGLKTGELVQKDDAANFGKVYTKDGELLAGISVHAGKTLVIR